MQVVLRAFGRWQMGRAQCYMEVLHRRSFASTLLRAILRSGNGLACISTRCHTSTASPVPSAQCPPPFQAARSVHEV